MFQRVLIANRGEISVRIARTLREMGIVPVAVCTDAERGALHTRVAGEAHSLGSDHRAYLDIQRIVDVARRTGCDALHPGYGFLSENADFAEACERAGLAFIGPPAPAIRRMGEKQSARAAMAEAGVPVVPGGDARTLDEARATARAVGYPILIKATAGGGGKGMRLVHTESDLSGALERTRSEALGAFGSDAVYIEKAIVEPRHVEVQILGDRAGRLVHLFERDCSIQRRHQKIIEETPCPALHEDSRRAMCEVALRGAAAIGYFSAGTFEFLLARDGSFYFLEMNTRLQVEHPITELVTGVDLVREMVRVAAGLPLDVAEPVRRGAAVEARIYAEDPASGFLPSPGTISEHRAPGGPGIRDDSGIFAGATVSADYDPLLGKLSVWAEDRERALARMRRALSEYVVTGIRTNLAFLERVFSDPDFALGNYDTSFIDRRPGLFSPARIAAGKRKELAAALAVAKLHEDQQSGAALPHAPSRWLAAGRRGFGDY
jgi:acetyl-CoA carboxylase biotin carboxylase subunit